MSHAGPCDKSEAKIFGVTGAPILHSRSPQMFNTAFKHLRLEATYLRIAAADAREALSLARAIGFRGFNVTSPFKEEIAGLMDASDETASELAAVNTLVVQQGAAEGFNTDPSGVLGALADNGFEPAGKKAVVLGAGGAAKAAAYALTKAGVESATIINRTSSKARAIAQRLGCRAAPIEDLGSELARADLLISCLPAGVRLVDASHLRPELTVLDANYSASSLRETAGTKGCRTIDGLDWLLHQALASFKIFTGLEPPRKVMRDALYGMTGADDSRHIALIGFMGAGKTTIGKILSAELRKDFLDLDTLIENSAGKSIAQIFAADGETAFRRMESSMLQESLNRKSAVIACGGGAILSAENRRLLKQKALTIWLWAPVEVCLSRVTDHSRPLLNGPQPKQAAASLLESRKFLYARAGDLLIDNSITDARMISRMIADEIHQARQS